LTQRQASFSIAGRAIGRGHPAYVIAEIGINHEGSEELCAQMIAAAAQAGADAVKLQTVVAEESYHPDTQSYGVFRDAALDRDALERLIAHAAGHHIALFSTPGDPASLRLLSEVKVPALKISSGLLTNLPLVKQCAATGLPIILSTGMAHFEEVEKAVTLARETGAKDIAVLQCTSLYPALATELNLRAMDTLGDRLGVVSGYSDHYDGDLACIAAVAAGAGIIEKHFTTTPDATGADHAISAGPEDFARLVASIRDVEAMLGTSQKAPTQRELPLRDGRHRRLVAARDFAANEVIAAGDVYLMRLPAERAALPAGRLDDVVGRRTTRAIARLNGLTRDMVEGLS